MPTGAATHGGFVGRRTMVRALCCSGHAAPLWLELMCLVLRYHAVLLLKIAWPWPGHSSMLTTCTLCRTWGGHLLYRVRPCRLSSQHHRTIGAHANKSVSPKATPYPRGTSAVRVRRYCVMQIPSQMAITRVGAPIWLAILVFCWCVHPRRPRATCHLLLVVREQPELTDTSAQGLGI